jgi:transposase
MVYKIPDAQLEEYVERLKELFDITVTKGQLSKFLASEGITHKKAPLSIVGC